MEALLDVRDLKVHLRTGGAVVRAVDGVDLLVMPGECVGIVGESGSGKSTLARAVSRLMANVEFAELSGQALFNGADTLAMAPEALRRLRRKAGFSMIFQDPMGYLNPTMRVGKQVREALSPGEHAMPEQERIYALLREVGLRDVEYVARRYPHELSGGMRQRIMIAIALASEPQLLFADEPTTALDATVQLRVLETLKRLHQQRRMGMVIITHDLGVVAALCDRVYVMNGGKVVEEADTLALFDAPRHPYSARLIQMTRRGREAAEAA
ncbi:ABC transporter ATP-binding protein [Ramlibacter sp. G-1-2-2]|uniref:ABC transporter ATP-binding protein n=1 Tax=Ramlibacter agri TaxID=2728837 RepID=A0A848H158_9BURK|nr:ABC transporter ATP-binding protein [Ramlibacter agri]NML44535.1 ABC transporter ATP-binding protein [Ramlibacter agri]